MTLSPEKLNFFKSNYQKLRGQSAPMDTAAQSMGADVSSATDLIKGFEGFRGDAYMPTPNDVPTVGYGNTQGVQMGQSITGEEASRQVQDRVNNLSKQIDEMVKVPLTRNQKTALISLADNVGIGALRMSESLRRLNAGDYKGFIQGAFGEDGFIRQKGEILPGLVKRRTEEARLFMTPDGPQTAQPKEMSIEYPQPFQRPKDWKDTADQIFRLPQSFGEVVTNLAVGMPMYMAEVIAGIGSLPFDPSAETAKKIGQYGQQIMAPLAPQTEWGNQALGQIGQGFEFVLYPAHKVADWIETEGKRPALAYLTRVAGEFLTLGALHQGVVNVAKGVKIPARLQRAMQREKLKINPDERALLNELIPKAEKEAAEIVSNKEHPITQKIRDRQAAEIARANAEAKQSYETLKGVMKDVKPQPKDVPPQAQSIMETAEAIKESRDITARNEAVAQRRVQALSEYQKFLADRGLTYVPGKGVVKLEDVKPAGVKPVGAEAVVEQPVVNPRTAPQRRASVMPEIQQVQPEVQPEMLRSKNEGSKPVPTEVKPIEPPANLEQRFKSDPRSLTTDELKQLEAENLKRYQDADYLKADSFEAYERSLNDVRKELRHREQFEIPDEPVIDPYAPPKRKSFAEALKAKETADPAFDYRDPGIFKDLKNAFGDERGALFPERLTPEQARVKAEAIERLVKKLKSTGKRMVDALIEAGLDPDAAREVAQKLGESPEEISKSPKSLLMSESGKLVQPRRYTSYKGQKIEKPGVLDTDLRGMKDANELNEYVFKGTFTPSLRQFRRAGDYFQEYYYKAREALRAAHVEAQGERKWLRELSRTMSRKEWEELGTYWVSKQKDGDKIIAKMGRKIEELSNKQLHAMKLLEERFARAKREQDAVRVANGYKPFAPVENYMTFFREVGLLEEMGLKPNMFNNKEFIADPRKLKLAEEVPFRFAKRRTGSDQPVLLNPIVVYGKYVNSHIKYKHLSPIVAKINEILKPVTDPKTGMKGSLKDYKPNLDRFLRKWTNQLMGIPDIVTWPFLEKGLRRLNENLTFAILAGNVHTMLMQPAVFRNVLTALDAGSYHAIPKAIGNMFKEGKARGLRESEVLVNRSMDTAIEDAYNAWRFGRLSEATQTVGQKVLSATTWLDSISAGITWEIGRSWGEMKGLTGKQLQRFADDFVVTTNASGTVVDRAPIQNSALGKALTLFQTYVISDWHFLMKDVLGYHNPEVKTLKRFTRAFKYVLATTMLNSFYEDVIGTSSPFPTPIRALNKAKDEGKEGVELAMVLGKEAMELMPILGGMRYGGTPLGPTATFIGEMGKQFTDDPFKKGLLELAMTGAGVPLTAQIHKMLRANERGEDAYHTLMGTNTKGNSGSRRSRRRPSRSRRRRD